MTLRIRIIRVMEAINYRRVLQTAVLLALMVIPLIAFVFIR